ncbi:MAG: DUF1592 domain-containing protein [Myxococcota bacterium]
MRLTNSQYANAVQDLLAPLDVSVDSRALADESAIGGFRSNTPIPVSDLEFRKYADEASRAAQEVTDPFGMIGCDPASASEEACARAFISHYGRLAYRRALRTDEEETLHRLFVSVREEASVADAGSAIVEALLLSPHFIYRVEVFPDATPGDEVPLTGYQIAARLALFLWDTGPDERLLAAAEAGELDTVDGVEMHARRMLDDPLGRRAVKSFHLQWLGLEDLADISKDTEVFPSFDSNLALRMRQETANFADHVVRTDDGRLATLLTGNYTMLRGVLYDHYGLARPAEDVWEVVALDGTERTGILTQGAFMTAHAHDNQTSPVHRGRTVRENIFCEIMPAPPPDVNDTPPELDADLTTRERFSEHSTNGSCVGCHQLMDPIGLGFEGYDGIGRFRPMEAGAPTDMSGEIVNTDVAGPFVGAVELSQRLLASEQARNCLVTNWFQFALGKEAEEADAGTIDALYQGFEATDRNIYELIVELVRSDAFRIQRIAEVE